MLHLSTNHRLSTKSMILLGLVVGRAPIASSGIVRIHREARLSDEILAYAYH